MIKHVLFDLDGVISDNSDGITNGVKEVLKHYGLEVPPKSELLKFIGPPLHDAFMEYLGLSAEESTEGVKVYREYYRSYGIFENVMYDGVPEMLSALYDAGYKLYLATSKPEEFARRICARFEIDRYFTYIGGATFDGSRDKKADVMRYVMNEFEIPADETIMVGDRHHDVYGSRECNVDCIGVLYGFGSYNELKEAGAVAFCKNPNDVYKIIENI